MDSLGSISVYFPLIDSDIKDVLETTMVNAKDYNDFVMSLTQIVLDENASDFLVYFAIHHSAQLLDLKRIDTIAERYGNIPILKPNIFFASHYQGKSNDLNRIIQAADKVIRTHTDDWLTLEMRFMKFEAETYNYPNIIHDSSNLDEIYVLIDSDSRFEFYKTVLYNNLARIADIDGNNTEWSRYNQLAIDNARKHDDQIRLAYCLIEQARISSNNRDVARSYLLEALEIMDRLGSVAGYADVLEQLSTIEMIRGEFSKAIENFLHVVSIRESMDSETGLTALMLSSLYNSIGEYESGLEWGKMAEDQFLNRSFLQSRAVLCQIWSLILLNRLSEAELLFEAVHESILKSGRESHFGWLHFVTGLLEYAKGDVLAATSSLEESLKIFEAHEGTLRYKMMPLYYLAMIEVSTAADNTEIFPYLTILEERAISNDLPGVLGQALILRSELALIQNDDAMLRVLLQKLDDLAKEPGLDFLSRFVENLMHRI
ncbi:MAG: hypothetical protein JW779_02395 [Candidatus Thorarchaeota archaeon]|nr:hypothetical protein [Candidatus Thorarchaeota archaeon]